VVFFSEVLKDLCRRSSLTPVHGLESLPNAFKGFGAVNEVEQLLIRRRILDNQFSFPVDGQHLGPPGLLQALDMLLGVPLKIRERVNIVDV
jgi:hypothetical protein